MRRIIAAARAAHAHEFICACPRVTTPWWVSAARACRAVSASASPSPERLLIDPRILILDEATSSVDRDRERNPEGAGEPG